LRGGTSQGNDAPPGSNPATSIQFSLPSGVATDTNGNVYITDTYDDRVDKVDTNGNLTAVAGYGIIEGFAGDGGPATNASVVGPKGVAVDAAQNIYIADTFNQRIRMIDSNGIINTIAGNGGGSPNGAYGGDGGAATNASFYNPISIIFDQLGNMYVADSVNDRVRIVSFSGLPYLSLSKVSPTNNGTYDVVVTSASGSVTSSIVSLNVFVPATIAIQPTNQVAAIGNNVTFTVGANGTSPLNFQWIFNGTILNGQTNSSLVLSNVVANQAGLYMVVVTNLYGRITSNVARLVDGYAPAITNLSSNQTVTNNSNLIFNVGVTGTGPFTYQWQFNGTNLPNKNNTIYLVAGSESSSGNSISGVLASNALMGTLGGVALDPARDIFIVDQGNNCIRMVSTNYLFTVAGGNGAGYLGDGCEIILNWIWGAVRSGCRWLGKYLYC
jgi:trimeric autotransporter adhesin